MIHLAFIGNGKSTNRYHLPFLRKLTFKYKIEKIFSRSSNSPWPKQAGVKYIHDLNEIWNDSQITLVIITTPPETHYQLAKEALLANKHVILEKPFVENWKQAKELFELAKQNGLVLQAYQNRRFDSDFLTLQDIIESNKLGELFEIQLHFDYYRPETPLESKENSALGSFLYGHGSHTVDQIISYFGKPDTVHYDVRQLTAANKMNDYFDLDLYYDKLKVSIQSSYYMIKPRPSMVAYGKKGMFIKQTKDRQEEHLKLFYMPNQVGFGEDQPIHFGTIVYVDEVGQYHEEKVVTHQGDYSLYYLKLYDTLENGKQKLVKDEETLEVIHILETGFKQQLKTQNSHEH